MTSLSLSLSLVYAAALGQFAVSVIDSTSQDVMNQRLLWPVTRDEFQFACSTNGSAEDSATQVITFNYFLLLLIMRLGRTSRDQLKRMSSIFQEFECDSTTGRVAQENILIGGHSRRHRVLTLNQVLRKTKGASYDEIDASPST